MEKTSDVLEQAARSGVGLTFDDVLLTPGYSSVVPSQVSITTRLGETLSLKTPLISADMDSVTDVSMARAMAMEGGIGFLWKSTIEEQVRAVREVKRTLNARIDAPAVIGPKQTKQEVNNVLAKHGNRFSTLVVVNEHKQVVGLVTSDLTSCAKEEDLVETFMEKSLRAVTPETTIQEAYNIMKEEKVPKLIVAEKDGTLKGLYTISDVSRVVAEAPGTYNLDNQGRLRVGANVGVHDPERVEQILKEGCDVILVGTAHGHSKNVIETIQNIHERFRGTYTFCLVGGNVATYEGAKALFEAGADIVKVGIGPGSICTTRVVAGIGVPQLSAIHAAAQAAREHNKHIIADGGIRHSGDIVKALAAGASAVMMGSIFAACEEAPGEIVTYEGQRFKRYRGMGSLEVMRESKASQERYAQGEKLVAEGVAGMVPLKGSTKEVINQYIGGLRSGMGYVGAETIASLQEKGVFQKITPAAQIEGKPHDITFVRGNDAKII